jgi:hypothetical protein
MSPMAFLPFACLVGNSRRQRCHVVRLQVRPKRLDAFGQRSPEMILESDFHGPRGDNQMRANIAWTALTLALLPLCDQNQKKKILHAPSSAKSLLE